MDENDTIGSRIATERKLRGLTQHQLATRANVSLSLLRKVEQGNRAASPALMTSVSRVLGVVQAKLTGQPYYSGDRQQDLVHDLVNGIRGEVAAYRLPPGDEDEEALPLPQLAAAAAELSRLRHAANFTALGEALPPALRALRIASFTYLEVQREQVMGLLAEAYDAARTFAYKIGHTDLASILADRYEWAAWQSGDLLAVAVGDTMRSRELLAAGQWSGAARLLDTSMAVIEPDTAQGRPEVLSMFGYLHLEAALAAARAGRADETWAHHHEAIAFADRLGGDRDDYRLAFGPTNAAIWGTALGVELLDAPAALQRADEVHLTAQTQPERAGHHFIDLARAHLLNGDRMNGLEALQRARRIAPQQTRHHPLAREAVHTLARAERRSSDSLRHMAAWMGVPD